MAIYLDERPVYPGLGVRKLMDAGSAEAGSRMVNTLGKTARKKCSIASKVLGKRHSGAFSRLCKLLSITIISNGFAEEFAACELAVNVAAKKVRLKPNNWDAGLAAFFKKLRIAYLRE